MSEVKDVRDSTGEISETTAQDVDDAAFGELSGYLCGVCEEPLPYGASACPACATPVAPLDDDEMVAGPYVFSGPTDESVGAPEVPHPHGGYDAETGPLDELDDTRRIDDPPPGPEGDVSPFPPPPAPAPFVALDKSSPSGNGHDHGSTAASGPSAPLGDPAELIGIERPTYPRPPLTDPGPDPMLGRAPTSPVLPPPAPREQDHDLRPSPPLGTGSAGRRAAIGDRRNPVPLLAGAAAAVLALAVVAVVILTRGGGDGDVATGPQTTAAAAPAPSIRQGPARRSPSRSSQPEVTGEPNLDDYCLAALQFKIDPDPDSVAAKFLVNPQQLVRTVNVLAASAPYGVRPSVVPLREAVHTLADQVASGELRTVADLRNAVDEDGNPMWPRFDLVVVPSLTTHCQDYLE